MGAVPRSGETRLNPRPFHATYARNEPRTVLPEQDGRGVPSSGNFVPSGGFSACQTKLGARRREARPWPRLLPRERASCAARPGAGSLRPQISAGAGSLQAARKAGCPVTDRQGQAEKGTAVRGAGPVSVFRLRGRDCRAVLKPVFRQKDGLRDYQCEDRRPSAHGTGYSRRLR